MRAKVEQGQSPAAGADAQVERAEWPALISCLMAVRRPGTEMRLAVDGFDRQTHADRELIIVDDTPDRRLEQSLRGIGSPRIRLAASAMAEDALDGPVGFRMIELSQADGQYAQGHRLGRAGHRACRRAHAATRYAAGRGGRHRVQAAAVRGRLSPTAVGERMVRRLTLVARGGCLAD